MHPLSTIQAYVVVDICQVVVVDGEGGDVLDTMTLAVCTEGLD